MTSVFKLTSQFLAEALAMPVDWEIRSITLDRNDGIISVVVSGDSVPAGTNGDIGAQYTRRVDDQAISVVATDN